MNSDQNRRGFIKTTGVAALAATALPVWAQSSSTITVAIMGVAHIHTPSYIDVLNRRPDVRVKYVWDHDASRAGAAARQAGAQTAAEPKVVWSDPEVNAVIILSETNLHRDLVLAAAQAHKSVFTEKPLGITGKDSLEMAQAIQNAGVVFTTGYFMRTDPKHLFLKDQIAAGNFGTITRIRGSNCHNGSLAGWFDHEWRWMADPKIAGVGAFGDLGTHKLDILMWFMGDVEAATADIRPVTHRYGDCDETGEGLIQFKNGTIGTLAAGWVDIEDPVQLLISGTQGIAMIMNDQLYYRSQKVSGSDSHKPWTDLPQKPLEPLDQFLNAVKGAKNQPLVTPAEAASRVVVMEAMYQGSAGRKWVSIGQG